ncbi:MAG: carboxypeptidase regulatory-like domain-containing protein [Methanosarcinales archaeon]|nr:carboxypeptidase regulatory-like domain-containing protein [Methanosarcinales archaeon]
MNQDVRNIAIAALSVLLIGIIAVALFLYADSDITLAFAIIGVPAAIIIASLWYIKSVKQRRLEDPAARVKIRELREIGREFLHLRRRMHEIEGVHAITIPQSAVEMEAALGAIESSGGSIDPDSQTVDCDPEIIKGVTLFAIREVGQNLDQARLNFVDRLHDDAVRRTDDARTKLEALNAAGYDLAAHLPEIDALALPDDGDYDLEEIVDYLDSLKIITENALRECANDADKLATHAGDLSPDVHDMHGVKVEEHIGVQDYGEAVSTLENGITALKNATRVECQAYRDSLLEALDIAIGVTEHEQFTEFEEEVLDASSPEKLVRLKEIGDLFVEFCQSIIDRMHRDISSTEDSIKEFMPPDYFWNESGLAEKEFTLDRKDATDVDGIRDAADSFAAMAGELAPALTIDRKAYKMLSSYHRTVERQIRKIIMAHDTLAASEDDLKVAQPDDFLRLYDYYHPDATYSASDRMLRLAEGAKVIENPLPITVTDANGNGIEGAIITLMRESGIGVTLKYVTGEDGCVTIENPGDGRYLLVVGAAEYREHEGTAVLPAQNLDVALERIGIKDYLCRKKAQSIKNDLKRYSSDVLKELDKSGIVSSEFDMYINREYRACLLYILSEEYANLRFVSSDPGYHLYDEPKMVSRLIEATKTMRKDSYTTSDFDISLPAEEILHLVRIAEEQGAHILLDV